MSSQFYPVPLLEVIQKKQKNFQINIFYKDQKILDEANNVSCQNSLFTYLHQPIGSDRFKVSILRVCDS